MAYKRYKTGIQSKFPLYFGFFMVVLYLAAGFYILFSPDLALESGMRNLFAFILICYAVIRGFRSYSKYKNRNDERFQDL